MGQSVVSTRTVWSGWLKVLVATVRTGSGEEVEREIVERGPAMAVLPYDPERRVAILVRAPRPAVIWSGGPAALLEAPAGLLDDDTPETCARREALEETGVVLRDLEPVAAVRSSPGMLTEVIHLFLAPFTAADRVGEGGGLAGEHEELEVVELPLARLGAMLDAGEIDDLKTLALVSTLRGRRPDLFG